jgi:hypothetical protein
LGGRVVFEGRLVGSAAMTRKPNKRKTRVGEWVVAMADSGQKSTSWKWMSKEKVRGREGMQVQEDVGRVEMAQRPLSGRGVGC